MWHKISYFVTVSFITVTKHRVPTGETQGTGLMVRATITCKHLSVGLGTNCSLLQKKMENREGRANAIIRSVFGTIETREYNLVTHSYSSLAISSVSFKLQTGRKSSDY